MIKITEHIIGSKNNITYKGMTVRHHERYLLTTIYFFGVPLYKKYKIIDHNA